MERFEGGTMMRSFDAERIAFVFWVVFFALPACGSVPPRAGPPLGSAESWTRPTTARSRIVSDALRNGIYVAQYYGSSIVAFRTREQRNDPPACTVPFAVSEVTDVAADDAGNLIDPDGGTHSIIIGNGPDLCGPMAATIADPYGQPSDASSADALHGIIAVANVRDNGSAPGSISVCTVAKGCTRNLTNPGMYEVGGVAMDKKGNCWATATGAPPSGAPALFYFKRCAGAGVAATNFRNYYHGGIDFDGAGNLVAIDPDFQLRGRVFVYSGCNPACKIVGGPFPLYEPAEFGHLNRSSKLFAAADAYLGQVDVYNYAPTKITYRYSFNNGLAYGLGVEGVTYNRAAR
jgi:hypothetical protein